MLLIILHNNEAANAKHMLAAQLNRAPFYLHAHGARVVVDLGYVAQDLRVYFCAHGFGEVFGELGVGDLAGEGLFDAEGGAFVEFWG